MSHKVPLGVNLEYAYHTLPYHRHSWLHRVFRNGGQSQRLRP